MSNCFICQFESGHSQVCPKHEETEWSIKFIETRKPKIPASSKRIHPKSYRNTPRKDKKAKKRV